MLMFDEGRVRGKESSGNRWTILGDFGFGTWIESRMRMEIALALALGRGRDIERSCGVEWMDGGIPGLISPGGQYVWSYGATDDDDELSSQSQIYSDLDLVRNTSKAGTDVYDIATRNTSMPRPTLCNAETNQSKHQIPQSSNRPFSGSIQVFLRNSFILRHAQLGVLPKVWYSHFIYRPPLQLLISFIPSSIKTPTLVQ
jgi:hypothetical protein